LFAREGAAEPLLELVAEGEQFLGGPGNEGPASEFFNAVARVAEEPGLAGVRDDLRDRARMGLAGKIRQRVEGGSRAGNLVSTMLGHSGVWAAPVVSDAQFAVIAYLRRSLSRAPSKPAVTRVEIPARIQVVTAAGWAPITGDLFLGFQSGEVVCYRPRHDEVVSLPIPHPNFQFPVTSLAISDNGEGLAVYQVVDVTAGLLSSMTRTGAGYNLVASRNDSGGEATRLYPILGNHHGTLAAMWNGEEVQILKGPQLLPSGLFGLYGKALEGVGPPETILLLSPFDRHLSADAAIVCAGDQICYHYTYDCMSGPSQSVGWSPSLPPGSTLHCPPLAWLGKGPEGLALAGISSKGTTLSRTDLEFRNGKLDEVTTHHRSSPEGYLAVTILRNKLVAGVTPSAVQLLPFGENGFGPPRTVDVAIPDALACFPWHRNNELLVVSRDGTVSRISL
jgi:hypothetical protein